MISADEPGATNIHPADVNGDGKMDFIASRGHGVADALRVKVSVGVALWPDHGSDLDVLIAGHASNNVVWFENEID